MMFSGKKDDIHLYDSKIQNVTKKRSTKKIHRPQGYGKACRKNSFPSLC